MKFLHRVFVFLLLTTLVLESEAWWRRRRRRTPPRCSTPHSPVGSTRSGCSSPYTQGECCYYRCLDGYIQVSGSTIRTCSNGRWTGFNLVCRRPPCSTPPSPAYTWMSRCGYPYTHGERCYYRCRDGYTQVSGSTTRTCSSGRWIGTNLVCRRNDCLTPPHPAHTIRSGCASPYTQGERCTYRCSSWYTQVSGSTTRTCSYGTWTGTNLVCVRACPSPPAPVHTIRSGCSSPYTQGERCTYRCSSGYTQVSGSTTRTCSNWRWTGTNLVCRNDCSSPPSPVHTIRSGCSSPYTQGERCTYRCSSGYTRVSGGTTRTCAYGTWTGTSLVCRRNGCPTPPHPADTIRSGCSSPYTNGERCYYRCRYRYIQVSGSTTRTCSDGAWTGTELYCRRPPTLHCDFQ